MYMYLQGRHVNTTKVHTIEYTVTGCQHDISETGLTLLCHVIENLPNGVSVCYAELLLVNGQGTSTS